MGCDPQLLSGSKMWLSHMPAGQPDLSSLCKYLVYNPCVNSTKHLNSPEDTWDRGSKHPAVPGKGPQQISWGEILLWRGAANPDSGQGKACAWTGWSGCSPCVRGFGKPGFTQCGSKRESVSPASSSPRAPEQERVLLWRGHCLRRCRHILQECRRDPAARGGQRGRKPRSAPRGCRLSRFPAQPPPSG